MNERTDVEFGEYVETGGECGETETNCKRGCMRQEIQIVHIGKYVWSAVREL
jgi:hypothetical protein